jgi:anti-sigma B factor antagonist
VRLDLTTADEFLKDVLQMISEEPADAVCDLSLVPYMSSSGVKALLNIQQFLKSHRFRLVLFNLTPDVQKLVELSELDHVFTIAKDHDSSLKHLSSG